MTSVSAVRSFDPVVFSSAPLPSIAFTGFRAGDLEVRLAANEAEILAAQALRYRIFFEEMAATPGPEQRATRRDFDKFDAFCDHLLVVDRAVHDDDGQPMVVGTYRLMRDVDAARAGGFYTAGEYEIAPGETIMTIVPDQDTLIVETHVAPQDIDQIRLGQPATLRFTNFNQRPTPEIDGEVSRIGADISRDDKTGPPSVSQAIASAHGAATVTVIDGIGHWTALEAARDVTDHLMKFL